MLAAVEDQPRPSTKQLDSFMESRFCQVHTPHPLGDDRERFLYLINDLQNRKDDYAAQLSNVTLASMSEKKGAEDDAKYRIVSSLLGRDPAGASIDEERKRDLLWHARLILKIGEILDQEEEELARSLLSLEETETDVFEELKGENDDNAELKTLAADLAKIRIKLDKPRTDAIAKRLLAWFRLTDGAALPSCPIWSTTRQEVVDILSASHEKFHQHEPELLASVQLPLTLEYGETPVSKAIEDFQAASRHLLKPFAEFFDTAAAKPADVDKQILAGALTDWHAFLNDNYPEDHYGRTAVAFYRFKEPLARYSELTELAGELVSPRLLAFVAT